MTVALADAAPSPCAIIEPIPVAIANDMPSTRPVCFAPATSSNNTPLALSRVSPSHGPSTRDAIVEAVCRMS